MFGLSRRRMKLGRVKKLQLSDSAPGGRSPSRPPKHVNTANNESAPASSRLNEIDCESPPTAPEIDECAPGGSDNWMILSITGDKPKPRFNHAATVIENKMMVVGGESANGLLDDVQVLDFDKSTWTTASSKLYLSPSSLPMKIPACKGHSLVSWGKKVLLIGGKTEPARDRVSVWAFDIEAECWSLMEAKGDIPVARSGHTVVRANSSLILFGGEDSRRRKMNDLYVFDLKSLTWLPLHCTGTGPSARCNHVATFYDRTLYIFGGASKSRTLNDLYSLDFDAMIWSRIKIQDFHPSPRAGCCGVLCGTRWYISGGGSRKKRYAETLIYDILKAEWSVANSAPPLSITSNKGFSLNLVQHQEKNFLVAFGGCKKEPSSQVEVLIVDNNESLLSHEPISRKVTGPLFGKRSSSAGSASQLSGGSSQRLVDSVARQSLASAVEQHGSGRKSLSESTLVDANPVSGNISLRKQFSNDEEYNRTVKTTKCMEDDSLLLQAAENRMSQRDAGNQTNIVGAKNSMEETSLSFDSDYLSPHNSGTGTSLADNDDMALPKTNCKGFAPASSSIYQFNGTKMASLIRKNGILEEQLASALANQEAMEKNLSSVLKSKQDMEKKLADTMKEMDLLKEKLAGLELAQEEATNLSNNVHSDNVRLEHDVAFLKAVLDDTQKELHSTRGVLAGERARTFQLQVEVFHLKQRLQSMENRAPTPRKPFHA